MRTPQEIREDIAHLVSEYYDVQFSGKPFIPGYTPVHCSGKVFGAEELQNGVSSILDGWWTEGPYTSSLEKKLAEYVGVKKALLTNSGSSSNLLAVATLTDKKMGDGRIAPGDEVITVAAGFPTTIAPIIQMGAVPVFVDMAPVESGLYNVDVSGLEQAFSPRTKAVILAHTLGNPFDLSSVLEFTNRHGLSLIEDACDALGSKYDGRKVGSFGDLATLSFYPAHHMTTGEGGALLTNNARLATIAKSFRNWGRDCWCDPGQDNSCGRRFGWTDIGKLPDGYDHKNIYARLGWNLKITDMQAAIGLAQFARLNNFEQRRKENFEAIYAHLQKYETELILPQALPQAQPNWFGFPISIRQDAGFTRDELADYLTDRKVMTRPIFAGNITRHPCMDGVPYRVAGSLENSDEITNRTFWVGVQPNITPEVREYMFSVFDSFFKSK